MKRFFVGAIMLCLLCLSANVAQAQRLDSRDTSQLFDNTIFATQDTNAQGNYRWSQTPYSVLRDSIRNYDPDPTGALIMRKLYQNNTFLYGDTTNAAQKAIFEGLPPVLQKGPMVLGESGYSLIRPHKLILRGVNSQFSYAAINMQTINKLNNYGNVIFAYYGHDDVLTPSDIDEYPTAGRDIFEIRGEIFKPGGGFYRGASVAIQTTETHSATGYGTRFVVNATKNGETNTKELFVVNHQGSGKWSGASYSTGWAKFENGVLEQMSDADVLNELATTAPVGFTDNASARAALGTGKAWRDPSGFLRVTY